MRAALAWGREGEGAGLVVGVEEVAAAGEMVEGGEEEAAGGVVREEGAGVTVEGLALAEGLELGDGVDALAAGVGLARRVGLVGRREGALEGATRRLGAGVDGRALRGGEGEVGLVDRPLAVRLGRRNLAGLDQVAELSLGLAEESGGLGEGEAHPRGCAISHGRRGQVMGRRVTDLSGGWFRERSGAPPPNPRLTAGSTAPRRLPIVRALRPEIKGQPGSRATTTRKPKLKP